MYDSTELRKDLHELNQLISSNWDNSEMNNAHMRLKKQEVLEKLSDIQCKLRKKEYPDYYEE